MSATTWDRALLLVGVGLLAVGCVGWWLTTIHGTDPSPVSHVLAIWLAAGVLLVVARWRWQQPGMAPLPGAVGLAVVAPLCMEPIAGLGGESGVGMALVVASAALLPLGWLLTAAVADAPARLAARLAMTACLAGALVLGVLTVLGDDVWGEILLSSTELWWVIVSVGVWIGAAAAALAAIRRSQLSRGSGLLAALGYLGIGLTVSAASLALAVSWWPTLVVPVLAVVATIAFLGRFAIQPLTVEVGTARAERDLVVTTLEAERSRIASTIHDGPLGDLALLVQRLDASGDADSAMLARSIATDLRSLGNELRLPILEDLGAGPAIEWLAGRVTERTQLAIQTDLHDAGTRPPAPVELAVFRVAQEALINAAKHGRGPVTVRYEAAMETASLSVTDAGPGINSAARTQAPGDGHLGLRLMAQRAEAVGAWLDVASGPGGGTSVRLEWVAS